jgi:hypothetical protein
MKTKGCSSLGSGAEELRQIEIVHYHGQLAKTSRRRYLGRTVSNAPYAK